MSGECLDGVCGSPTVSGSYLGVSSRCLGEYRCHINHKQLNRSRQIKLLPFLPVTNLGQKVLNFGVSGGCLRVSGWCLSSSGKCMGGIFVRQVENSWIRVVIFSWCSFSQWPRMSQKGAKARIRLFTGRGGFFGPGWLILLPNGLFWSTTNFWRGDGVKFWFRPFINTR